MAAERAMTWIVPGSIRQRTGGYIYDQRIVDGLKARGWTVEVLELDPGFPCPTVDATARATTALRGLPDRALTVIDGLALGAFPASFEPHIRRLRAVGLVHHPLASETGLSAGAAATLRESERLALEWVQHVVVTSRPTRDALQQDYEVDADRISIIEPGTDPAPIARGSGGDVVHLLCVGTVTPRKGHDVLIQALARVNAGNWRLTCVGSVTRDPVTVERLRDQIEIAGLTSHVVLEGETDAQHVAFWYDSADVFVLPTWHEGYGMAVAEALARGLPVIATPTGGIAGLVGDEAGILVPAGDVAALAAALSAVIGDSPRRQRLAAGAQRVRATLRTWDDATAMWAGVLESQTPR